MCEGRFEFKLCSKAKARARVHQQETMLFVLSEGFEEVECVGVRLNLRGPRAIPRT